MLKEGKIKLIMGGMFFAETVMTIMDLSLRAVVGSLLVVLTLLFLAALFKSNKDIKQYIYILVVAAILFASTILFTTALSHVKNGTTVTSAEIQL